MRRLVIAALSALILLCIPISTLQGRGLHSIRWTLSYQCTQRCYSASRAPPAQALR